MTPTAMRPATQMLYRVKAQGRNGWQAATLDKEAGAGDGGTPPTGGIE